MSRIATIGQPRRRLAWFGCAGLALAVMALPQESNAEDWKFKLGAGVGIAPDYEGSEDYEAVPILIARASKGNRYLELFGNTVRANLLGGPVFSAGPAIIYRPERDDVDNDAVDDLDDVDDAIELGGFIGMNYQGWLARATLTQDVNDGHDGLVFNLLGGYRLPLAPAWSLTTTISTTYADEDYMDSYFTIDGGDAADSGLDEFDADSGFKDVGVGLRLAWGQDTGLGVTGIASFTRLLGDAEDSPVVDDEGDENQFFGGLALTYAF